MSNGKILTAGCSHTRDFMTNPWPSFINNTFNIGIRGAGPDFGKKQVKFATLSASISAAVDISQFYLAELACSK